MGGGSTEIDATELSNDLIIPAFTDTELLVKAIGKGLKAETGTFTKGTAGGGIRNIVQISTQLKSVQAVIITAVTYNTGNYANTIIYYPDAELNKVFKLWGLSSSSDDVTVTDISLTDGVVEITAEEHWAGTYPYSDVYIYGTFKYLIVGE